MTKKRFLIILCTLLLSLVLVGCASQPRVSKETELRGVMTAEELAELDKYPNLRLLDLSGSRCYGEIEAYIAAHPEVTVRYTVAVGETEYAPDTETVSLAGPAEIDELLAVSAHLPRLRTVELQSAPTAEELETLRQALPQAELRYQVELLGKSLPSDQKSLDLSGADSSQVPELVRVLPLLPQLEQVELSDDLPLDDYLQLKAAAPQAHFRYAFTLFGQELNTDTASLEYRNVELGDEGVRELQRVLAGLDRLQSVYLERVGAKNKTIAELRDAYPDKDIVWLVEYGWTASRSDAITIWNIGGFNDEQLAELKYCTKVKYLDLGHNGIYDISFVEYMPDLEVLILENDFVSDLTPLATCKNLEYLEVGETRVTDVSPLANVTSLRHLNIGGLLGLTDISPLYGLPNLERLYGLCDVNVPREQVEYIKTLMPNTEIDFDYYPKGAVNGSHWRYTENGELVPRYQLLHDQIGYDW